MRAAVHPDRAGLLVGADVVLDGDDALGFGILLLPDSQLQRTVVDVRRDVHAALVFLEREARRVPAVGEEPRGAVDRQAKVVAKVGTRSAILLVFVIPVRIPVAGKNRLCVCGLAAGEHRQGHADRAKDVVVSGFSRTLHPL